MKVNIRINYNVLVINLLVICFSVSILKLNAQNLTGFVYEKDSSSKTPLQNINIRWKNAPKGVISQPDGSFVIKKSNRDSVLIISSVAHESQEIQVAEITPLPLQIYLQTKQLSLQETVIVGRNTNFSQLNPILTEKISSKILSKAACCNLSESFETNAAVSVSVTDAVTGAKQLQMLGLAGNYIQTNTENIPNIRGLNSTFGLNYTPGTWIKSIDIAKGMGSVINGYESMAGAINVELAKPDDAEKIQLNLYFNNQLRSELNVVYNHVINKKWSIGSLNHISFLDNIIDNNNDSFLDLPLFQQYNSVLRWKYVDAKWMTQFGIKAIYENRLGGQTNFDPKVHRNKALFYGFASQTQRFDFFTKTARLFENKPYKSIALISNIVYHKNDSYFGFKNYIGTEKSIYLNFIYQNIIQNTNHQYKAGFSFLGDYFQENYQNLPYLRSENVPGFFFEWTETLARKVTLVAGSRLDFHNIYGKYFTPRIHLKYEIMPNIHFRANAGRGWRVPNVFAENFGNLVNNRTLVIAEKILPEVADNFGLSLTTAFDIKGRQASLVIDGFRTNFQNQLIVDMESADNLSFYNLKGRSFSNSFQVEFNYSPIKKLDTKLAYRYFLVKNDVATPNGSYTLLEKQFINKDRILFNVGYATDFDKWKFDFTWQWNGKRRIPNTAEGHVHTAFSEVIFAPAFSNFNAQITRSFYKWELYLGGENLGGFTQKNPIFSANDPFAKSFDGSMTWGPIVGRMVYVGGRMKIK